MTRVGTFLALLLAAPSAWAQTNVELIRVQAPSTGLAGESIEVELVLDLASTFAVDDVQWEVLLTPGVDIAQGVVIASGTISTLAGARTLEVDATLPADRLGLWRVAGRIDPQDRIDETNEFDNVDFAPVAIRVEEPRPDFVVDQVDASRSEVAPGDALTVEARVRNLGPRPGAATARAVLSRGGLPTADDPELGTGRVQLDPGESQVVTINGTVPDLLAGPYQAGVLLDVDQPDRNPADDLDTDPREVVLRKSTLVLLTQSLVDGVVGLPYSAQFAADGGDGTYAFARTSGALPAGLRLEDGALSGTPRESGSFSFTIEVTSRGLSDAESFELEVLPTTATLVVVTSTLPSARLGTLYDHVLVAGGGEAPYTWEVTAGELPPGLLLTGDRIEGTPTEVGAYPIDLRVTDRLGATAQRSFQITVSTSNSVLVDPAPLPVAAAGVRYEAQLQADGGTPPYRWRALSDLPVGLTLSTTGRLTGTPGRPGDFIFRVEVTDATDEGISDRSLLFLTVEDAENFTIIRPEIPTLRFGNRFDLLFDVEGGVPPYTWSLTPGSRLPRNSFFTTGEGEEEGLGVLFGAPTEQGTFGLGIVVQDGQGRRREAELALRVTSAASAVDSDGGCQCLASSGSGSGTVGWSAWGLVALAVGAGWRRKRPAPG